MFNTSLIKKTLLFIILAELLSFFAWLLPQFNAIVFFVILAVTLILSLYKLEYGLYILLAELFVGSKGYLFSLELGETLISIRIGLFLVVMSVWLVRFLQKTLSCHSDRSDPDESRLNRDDVGGAQWRNPLKSSRCKRLYFTLTKFKGSLDSTPPFAKGGAPLRMTKLWGLLFLVIAWGFIWGLIRGNNFGNVFLDFNNWLYFLLIFPVYWVYNCRDTIHRVSEDAINGVSTDANNDFIKNILSILIASVVWTGIKSLILLYIFSHQFVWALPEVYKWVRDTGVGEVTLAGGGFYRVFLQSQIYSLLLFFILLSISNFKFSSSAKATADRQISKYLLLIICLTTVILSFSRSYWVGFIITLLLYYFIILVRPKGLSYRKFLDILKSFVKVVIIAALSLGIVFLVVNLPPKVIGGDLASLLGKRASELEAAGVSRVNQLKPLSEAIIKHPVIGSGFGTTLTYITDDPRVVPETAGATGEFTTYAFEWGYLDMVLKFGLVGVAAYLILIYKILKGLLKSKIQLRYGFALALISLLVVNIFSPYLNHPLGIGFIILAALMATN